MLSKRWTPYPSNRIPPDAGAVPAQVAHMVPHKLCNHDDFHQAAFRYCGIPEETFRGVNIDRVGNLLLLRSDIHLALDDGRWGLDSLTDYKFLFCLIEPRPAKYLECRNLNDGGAVDFG